MGMKKEEAGEFEFFDLNMHQLDVEWIRQPKLYFTYAKKLADARRQVDELRAQLDLDAAELDKEIRTSPEDFGLEKITEPSVKQCILTQKRYTKTQNALIEAKHKADVFNAVVEALEHRKRALEKLVDLHGRDYFSEPSASDNAREKMGKVAERSIYERARPKRQDTDE